MEKINKFRDRLKTLRNEHGMTAEELAKVLGVGRTTISNYETGYREPDFDTMLLIADYFDVTVDYLLGHANNRHGAVATGKIDGHDVKVEYDATAEKYAEGFTQEELERVYKLAKYMKEHGIL